MAREFRSGRPAYQVAAEPRTDEPRTYIVLGTPRGGTSMVAGLVQLCGVSLGDDLPNNHEDPAFNLEQHRRSGGDAASILRTTIQERDAAHEVWGWKYPRAAEYLDDLRPLLRNPHLIVVLRDPVAAAGRPVARYGADPMTAIRSRHRMIERNLDLVDRWQVPTLMVSYERSISRPFKLAKQVAEFLGMPAPADRELVREFVQPGTYQDLP